MGREMPAPSGKESPCIRAAHTWPRLGGRELPVPGGTCTGLLLRGVRRLIVLEATGKIPEPGCQLLPTSQMHHSGDGPGAGSAQLRPYPTLSQDPRWAAPCHTAAQMPHWPLRYKK